MDSNSIKLAPNQKWTGVFFQGDPSNVLMWSFTCPCGVKVQYPTNGLPDFDTKHPCDNPDHWTVRIGHGD